MAFPTRSDDRAVIEVIHFQRKPGARAYSIERLFADIRAALPDDIRCTVHVSPFESRGFFPRCWNVADAAYRGRRRRAVNHVTGDVHILTFGLPPASTILTIHDCGVLHRRMGLRLKFLRWLWFSLPAKRSRIIVADSLATRDDLAAMVGVPKTKVRVIPACVSEEFTMQPIAGTDGNIARWRILMLGTAPNKNLERMADSLSGFPCTVELVGNPSVAQAAAFRRNEVELIVLGDLGNAEIIAAYGRCDMVLFASTHEGFGLPILEAQAVGRPVVTANCSSMPEVAADAACLVNPFDPKSIRDGVERVIGDVKYREHLIAMGFRNIERFRPEQIARQYAALYREISSEQK
jgi:glycosyltransferase involved in cell wall biosynthesis